VVRNLIAILAAMAFALAYPCTSTAGERDVSGGARVKDEKKKEPVKQPAISGAGSKAALTVVESIHDYKIVAGKPLRAYVYKQPGDAVRPAIISLHPGALMMGSPQMKVLDSGKPVQGKAKFIEQGYAVVSLEYRLAPNARLPEIIDDLRDGYAWVHDKGPAAIKIDPSRIGVMGTSAGGYLALMSGTCVTPRPRFLIAISGYGDITGDWYAKPDPFYRQRPLVTEKQAFRPGAGSELYLYCRQNGLWPKVLTGHDPATEPEWFKPYCPVQNITADYPPTLLLHGDQDSDVPYDQSAQMDKELTAKGVEHLFILNRGAGHGILAFNPNNNVEFNKLYDRLIDFANRHSE
jgi:acetyl esterase/lipase